MDLQEVKKETEEILLHDAVNNTLHGAVCLVCDKLMKRKERCNVSLKTFLKSHDVVVPLVPKACPTPNGNVTKVAVDGSCFPIVFLDQCSFILC